MPVRRTIFLLALLIGIIPFAVGKIYTNQIEAEETDQTPQNNFAFNREAFTVIEAVSNDVSTLGAIEANEVAQLHFLIPGEVAEVMVEAGDYVEVGTILARLDNTEEQVAYDQALLNLERAQINLEELFEPVDEDDIRLADLDIASAQASYSDVANSVSEESLRTAELRYQQAQEAYQAEARARQMMSGTEEEITLQDAAIGAAAFDMEITRLQLEDMRTPDSAALWSSSTRIVVAQLEKELLLAGPTQADIDSVQLAVRRAEARLQQTETALQRTQLIAPVAGVVTTLSIESTQPVTSSFVALEISDLSSLWLTTSIHELDLDRVHEGLPATITLDALPDEEFPATVADISWIGVETDGIVEYTTRLLLNANDPRIRIGMTGEALIDTEGE